MTHYRELTNDEEIALARSILDANENRHIHEFIVNIYGLGRAESISIETETNKYGPEVCAVYVYNKEGKELFPDFSLPYWQHLADIDILTYLNEYEGDEAKFEEIYSHLRNDSIYLEYAIPAENIDNLFLPTLSLTVSKKVYIEERNDQSLTP